MLDIGKTGTSRIILAKARNIQLHENLFSISRDGTFRRTGRKEERPKFHLLSFHSRTNPKSRTVNVYCCWLLSKNTVLVIFSVLPQSIFTVQVLCKLYSVKLNCAYSNFTEAAAKYSAAQQERNCQAGTFRSEVQTLVWNYVVTHIQRLETWNSRYWLQQQCRSTTVIRNKWMLKW